MHAAQARTSCWEVGVEAGERGELRNAGLHVEDGVERVEVEERLVLREEVRHLERRLHVCKQSIDILSDDITLGAHIIR